MKSWLRDNNIEIYSTHNEGKVAKRIIRNLKEWNLQIYDFSIKKCVYWYIRWYSE